MKTYVYVLNKDGRPLMPTSPAKARRLLKDGKAKVVKRTPFTIQLIYGSYGYTQKVTLGVDTGYKNVGLSALSEKEELFVSEVTLRTDVSKKLTERRQYRKTRRSRLWYRKPRFLNRVKTKKAGWFAPSVEHRLNEHIKAVELVNFILPVSQINVETAAFDIQKIKNPEISGIEYQNGEQKDFWNIREYVLYRDNHTCSACNGKSKDKILNVHHLKSCSEKGTDRPDNLLTLCETCHKGYHSGKIKLGKVKPSKEFKAETFMGMVRWKLVKSLRAMGYAVSHTYGYITKSARLALKLTKSHVNDAFCIAEGDELRERADVLAGTFTRRNNRSLQTNRKGYKPSIRRKRYVFQPKDLVVFAGNIYIVKGIQNLGKYIKLSGLKKPVKTDMVSLIKYGRGLQFIPAL